MRRCNVTKIKSNQDSVTTDVGRTACSVDDQQDLDLYCCKTIHRFFLNPLIPTLKPQSNGLLYSNTVTGTLAVDGWAVTFGTARMGLGGLGPRPVPSSLYQM